jgi:ATP-binding cassette subfamily B protein
MNMSKTHSFDRDTIRIFWQAGLREKRLLGLAFLHPLGAICLSMLVPLFVGKILAALVLPSGDPEQYLPYFIAAAVVGALANRYGFIFRLAHQAKTMSYLQIRSLEALLGRSVGFHNNNVGGKLVSDAIDYQQAYSLLSGALFTELIPFTAILTAGTIIVFMESWVLGLLVLAMSVFALGTGIVSSRKRAPIRMRRLKATKALTSHLADTILNMFTVKTFARESDELAQHTELNHTLLMHRLTDWRAGGIEGNNRIIGLLVLQLLFILATIKLVQNDPLLLGIGIFAFSFTITLSNKLFEINTMLRNIEDGLLQASPMTEIILQEPEIQDQPHAKQLRVTEGAITFQNVNFHYQDAVAGQNVFSELNLHIAPGEKIGLVGPSGGGKSTLTRLLLRFEDTTSGTIAIDGQAISSITQASLRSNIAYVPQEPLLFHRSIRNNIAYGKPEASDDMVIQAARLAHADEFIDNLPDGYDTIVGERGVKLSGGQRQRIAIARAILKDAPILILDEATSALDSESEVLIQEALWKLMQHRTTIVIAHRLSTIQKMDRIIVLEAGNIAEEDTHARLLNQKGTYARLWAHQSGGFMDD